ncbi:hypothetical protein AB0E67_12230 [Streptomyces sp. NPDC032161]|uniref:hypothetical protein n=1 Tax=unclassified Streptomyces TaxID=2593676 RepID=UPI0033C019D5
MKIIVHDTASAMLDLLRRPLKERPDALRDMLSPLQNVTGDAIDLVGMRETWTAVPDRPGRPEVSARSAPDADDYRRLGSFEAAAAHIDAARTYAPGLPQDPYGELLRGAVQEVAEAIAGRDRTRRASVPGSLG